MKNLTICLLASGALGFKILKYLDESDDSLVCVFTDHGSKEIIDYCESRSILLFRGNPRGGKSKGLLPKFNCEVLLSVNYLFIIENDLIKKPTKYAINIHGSKLPRYRGRTPHVWAIINGETETGITAHLIDEKLDNGNIVEQIKVPIENHNTGADILTKFHGLYPNMVRSILEKIKSNRLRSYPQEESEATYFGKRTPNDGEINWDWHRERIYNWIRAQADPYPGAFTFVGEDKLIIHKSNLATSGFKEHHQNGEILDVNNDRITVKTGNGTLVLSQLVSKSTLDLKPGIILG